MTLKIKQLSIRFVGAARNAGFTDTQIEAMSARQLFKVWAEGRGIFAPTNLVLYDAAIELYEAERLGNRGAQ
jgi:hypothetical protein